MGWLLLNILNLGVDAVKDIDIDRAAKIVRHLQDMVDKQMRELQEALDYLDRPTTRHPATYLGIVEYRINQLDLHTELAHDDIKELISDIGKRESNVRF